MSLDQALKSSLCLRALFLRGNLPRKWGVRTTELFNQTGRAVRGKMESIREEAKRAKWRLGPIRLRHGYVADIDIPEPGFTGRDSQSRALLCRS